MRGSSMVEHSAVNTAAAGSSPAPSAKLDKPLFYKGEWRHITHDGWVVLNSHRKCMIVSLLDLDAGWDFFVNETPPTP